MKRFLETRSLFVIIVMLGLFIMAARSVTDPDVWWHLRTGQLILQHHALFHTDPYSFTKGGQPWIDHEWLSQVLIFGLYRVAGWAALIVGFAAIIAATFLVAFLRSPGRPFVAGVITVWGALASVPCWGARPQMLTLLLASILLWVLDRSCRRTSVLWWALPLMLLWVNLHAGYALGLALLVLWLLGDALDVAFGKSPGSAARFRTLALLIVACVAVVPLNPYGVQMYRYPLDTLRSRAMLAYIGEWLSPDFHQHQYLPALLLMLASLALPALSPKRLCPRELLLLVVTMYGALRSVRHLPVYVLVAVPLLSGMIQSLLEERGKTGLFEARGKPPNRLKMLVNLVLLAAFLTFTIVRLGSVIRHQPKAESRAFPAAVAAFLATTRPPAPLMNHYNWGGYFIWKLYPEYQVYIDGRADLYGDSFLNDFASTYYLKGRSWQTPLEQWGLRTVVLPPDAPLITALRTLPGWKVVFSDQQAVVLTRSD